MYVCSREGDSSWQSYHFHSYCCLLGCHFMVLVFCLWFMWSCCAILLYCRLSLHSLNSSAKQDSCWFSCCSIAMKKKRKKVWMYKFQYISSMKKSILHLIKSTWKVDLIHERTMPVAKYLLYFSITGYLRRYIWSCWTNSRSTRDWVFSEASVLLCQCDSRYPYSATTLAPATCFCPGSERTYSPGTTRCQWQLHQADWYSASIFWRN